MTDDRGGARAPGRAGLGKRAAILPLMLAVSTAAAQTDGTAPVDLADPLVGTAPLDDPAVIGNAPPPGEPVYSGQTSPGARLPHGSVEAAPVNNNIELQYPNGVPVPYYYTNPTMIGFTGGGGPTYGGNAEPIVMPVVGDWSPPPPTASHIMTRRAKEPHRAIIRSFSTASRPAPSSPRRAGPA